MDSGFDKDVIQQRLQSVAIQREEIHQLEIELRAKLIARNEIMEVQNNYESQLNHHNSATVKLKDQLLERERRIHDLEAKMEERDKELHDIKLVNQAAWAKEDLIREQSKELANFRRERNISEAEIVQHRKQLHDLQERSQENERQFIELQEQNKAAQETIIFKDEQLREAQSWISHIQEMDSMQSSTIHSLQAELRERTEQYNQLWLGCQKQFAEMERYHLNVVKQLHMADSREINGTAVDNSCVDDENGNNVVRFGHDNGNRPDVSEVDTSIVTMVPCADIPENISSVYCASNPSTQVQESVHECTIPVKTLESGQRISSEGRDMEDNCAINISCHVQVPVKTESVSPLSPSGSNGPSHTDETTINISRPSVPPIAPVPVISNASTAAEATDIALLDERSLLACIVRTIPPGSDRRVQISSTLPNRLCKVLAPLSWDDYKSKYGNLGDFVTGHPELFVVEGDHVQLQDGAQEIVAATSAVAKVAAAAAAAAASVQQSSLLHNVSVTPMAHHKTKDVAGTTDNEKPSSGSQIKHSNGVCIGENLTSIKILKNTKKEGKINGSEETDNISSRSRADRNGLVQDRGMVSGRNAVGLSVKHQRRKAGVNGTCKQ